MYSSAVKGDVKNTHGMGRERQGPFSQMALVLLLLGLLYFRDVPTIQEVNIVTAVQRTIMISPK